MEMFLKNLFKNQNFSENNFFLIAGPCVVESEELLMEVASSVKETCAGLQVPFIFKSSYKKSQPHKRRFIFRAGRYKSTADAEEYRQ